MLALVRLPDFADKPPHELSGGMRQRVALAQGADELLMDEPLGVPVERPRRIGSVDVSAIAADVAARPREEVRRHAG